MSLFSLLFKYKDKKSPDKLGLYPESFHIPSFPERRYLWASRILVICAVFSICVNIALTSIVYILIPQKTSKPSLFSLNETTGTLNTVEPQQISTDHWDMLAEGYIHEYINMRHSVPRSTADLYYRWDKTTKFYWYSSHRVYNSFINKLDTRQIRNFIKQQMKRIVEIDYVKKITKEFWEVQFKTTTTTKKMQTPDTIIWKAYLRVGFYAFQNYENIEKSQTEKMNYTQNPFGFKILSYSLNYAGKPEKAYTAIQTAKKVFENLEDVVK